MKKCGILMLQRGKVVRSEGIQLLNGSLIKDIEGSGYKHLGILEKENEMKSLLRRVHKEVMLDFKVKIAWKK